MTDLKITGLSPEATRFLKAIVEARCNLVVTGDLRVDREACLAFLESLIPRGRKVVSAGVEANLEEGGSEDWVLELADAQPDHVLVPCWSGDNFLDVLRLVCVSDGVMTFAYGKGPRAALSALELAVAPKAPNLPLPDIRQQVSAGFQATLHTERGEGDTARVRLIADIQGMEGDVIVMRYLFERDQDAGLLRPTRIRPKQLLRRLQQKGIELPEDVFGQPLRF